METKIALAFSHRRQKHQVVYIAPCADPFLAQRGGVCIVLKNHLGSETPAQLVPNREILQRCKTAYSAGRDAIVGDMVDAIVTLRERWGTAKLAGIGVAVPALSDCRRS